MQGIITDGVRLEVAKGLARGESRPAVARRVGISNMSISRMVYKPKFARVYGHLSALHKDGIDISRVEALQ